MVFATSYANNATTKILGVMNTANGEEGITADLLVNVVNGTGKVFISTIPLTEIDTQASARLAKEVACDTLNINCNSYDFYYEIYSDSPIVGGPSAGGAMTITTMAALMDLKLYSNVYMTGTVNPDGSIGPVGGILSKAEAAFRDGAGYVLIPSGQSIAYVEETKTVTVGPITQTETTVKPVNVTQYAKDNWGLTVAEVSDVEAAFKWMTGYEIVKEKRPTTLATADYYSLTKDMSESLLSYATNLLANATEYLNNNSLSYSDSKKVQDLLDQSRDQLTQAEQLSSIHQHYSAASYCVQSAILSSYAQKLVSYYAGVYSTKEKIKEDIDDTKLKITETENETISSSHIDHIYDIELLIVSIDRLREAENVIDESYKSYYAKSYEDALYYDSFAEIRLLTSQQWNMLMNKFNGDLNLTFDVNDLLELARERLESARVSLTYASTVATGNLLVSAQDELSYAEEAYNDGKYIFSIFESLKSMAEANLAMEVRGLTEDDLAGKIDSKGIDAEDSIREAEEEGLLPILAISYYEYSKSYTDPYQNLVFLSYSKEFAKIAKDFVRAISTESTYEQISGPVYIREVVVPQDVDAFAYLFIIAGFFAGITISLFSLERANKKIGYERRPK
jgi:uncharacterized protein